MGACLRSLQGWIALCVLAMAPMVGFAAGSPAEPAGEVLITGVPFVSVPEALALEAWVTFWTPSSRAAQMMVLRYYRPEAKTWDDYRQATDEAKGPLREVWAEAKSLDQLRPMLLAGHPVIVVTASTPYGHELYSMFELLLRSGARLGVSLRDLDAHDYSSGILGRVVSLDVQRRIGAAMAGMNTLQEIAIRCDRVVVGLDPARRVVIVHDVMFGPAWEVPYDDFERMWSAAGRSYGMLAPKDGSRPSVTAAAYPPRTADQRAAEAYLYGYSLAATGKPAEADERYRAGLAISGLSTGYRFIFLQERGYLAYRRKQPEEAVSLLRQATEQIPQAPGPSLLMARICRETGAAGGKTAADEFQKTGEKLAGDEAGMHAGAKAFPDNLASAAPLIALIPGRPPA